MRFHISVFPRKIAALECSFNYISQGVLQLNSLVGMYISLSLHALYLFVRLPDYCLIIDFFSFEMISLTTKNMDGLLDFEE